MRRTVLLLLTLCGCPTAEAPDQAQAPDQAPTGPWRAAAPLPEPRTEVAAALLGDRIYVLGGLAERGATARVDVYDWVADRWSSGPELPGAAPRHHLAVAVHGGRIFVLGGYGGDTFTPTAATWRLEGGAWHQAATQPVSRGAATAQTFGDRILVAGGADDKARPLAALYAYDPVADRWGAPLAAMKVAREHLASCAVGKRMIVTAGRATGVNLRAAEAYDTDRGEWTQLPDPPTARSGVGAAALGDVCYVFGGEVPGGGPPGTFNEVEAFDAAAGQWATRSPMPTRRHGLAAVAAGGEIFVIGGGPRPGFTYSDVVEVFRP